MDFLKEVADVGRRGVVDALQSAAINRDAPLSPEVVSYTYHQICYPEYLPRSNLF